jgi:hypothetical protein
MFFLLRKNNITRLEYGKNCIIFFFMQRNGVA